MTDLNETSDFQLEKKTIRLSIVSLIMYGIVSLTSGGPFAFFPINEIVFFIVVSYFAISNFKKSRVSYLLFLSFSAIALLKNQLFLGIFMSNIEITNFLDQPVIQLLPYLSLTVMLVEMLRFFILTKKNIFIYPIILIIFIFGTYFSIHTFQSFSLLLFFIILTFHFKSQKETINSYSKSLYFLWFLLLFLKLSTLFSMYLYGFEMDF